MANHTENLDLYEIDKSNDTFSTFDIDTILNENWQKIDEKVVNKNGTVPFVAEQIGVDPTSDQGLVTKHYLDSRVSSSGLTPNALNSGLVDASGNANVLSYSGNTVSLASATTYTDYLGSKSTTSTALTATIPTTPVSSTFNMFIENGSLVSYVNKIYKQKAQPTQLSNPLNGINSGCVISNGVATGGSGCYVSLSSTLPISNANSWEFKTKYTHVSRSVVQAVLTGTQDKTSPCLFITSAGVLGLCLTSNGTSWDIVNGGNTTLVMTNGSTYYLKFGFDSVNGYYVKYNTDGGQTYTTCYTNSSTTKSVSTTYPYFLNSSWSEYSLGSLDLSQTSITINDYLWWEAYTSIKTSDIWVDTSVEPVVQKKFDGSTWNTYSGVYCGQAVTNSSGILSSIVQPEFNQNGYDVNVGTQGYRFPSLKKGVSKSVAVDYVAECDGYINAYGVSSAANQWVAILINGVTWQSPHSVAGSNGLSAWAMISKGATYRVSIGVPSATVIFYPAEGVK